MVEDVEGIHSELERMRLLDRERFLERDVPVLLIGRAPGIARGSPPACSSGAIAVRKRRRRTEAFRSQVMIDTL